MKYTPRMDTDSLAQTLEEELRHAFVDALEISVDVKPPALGETKGLIDVTVVSKTFEGLSPVKATIEITKKIGHLIDYDRFVYASGGRAA